jgi:hypothetical protein
MNPQEIFSTSKRKLLAQGKRSMSCHGSCLYAGPNNTNCAVGVLLTPQELEKVSPWEKNASNDTGVPNLFEVFPDIATRLGEDNRSLLKTLQAVHDLHEPEEWPAQFTKLAAEYGLEDK